MRKSILLFILTPAFLFPLAALVIVLRNQAFLNTSFSIIVLYILVIAAVIFFLGKSEFLEGNIHGLILFLSFTGGYFLLAQVFNRADVNTNNIYFAADNASWLQRMSLEDG